MNRSVEPGLEVEPSSCPQIAPQPDENRYYAGSGGWTPAIFDQSIHPALDQPKQSNDQSQTNKQGLVKVVWIAIAILCLAVALGVGVGLGLSAQHKRSSPR